MRFSALAARRRTALLSVTSSTSPSVRTSSSARSGALQGTRDLNPQPSVLETDALPVELVPSDGLAAQLRRAARPVRGQARASVENHQTGSLRREPRRSPNRAAEPRTPGRPDGPRGPHYDGRMTAASSPRARRVSDRIGAIAESATLAVDAKAKALKAAGRPVIGFGAGEPDFPTPDYIVEAAVEACRDPKNHRYTPAGGLPELKEAIAEKTAARLRATRSSRPRCWSPTAASRRSTRRSPRMLDPGDEVIVPAPYWTTYPEAIRLAGGVPGRGARRRDPGLPGHRRAARGGAHRADQGAAVRLPVQPDRRGLHRRRRSEAIGRWAEEHGLWVVTDEIYEHLVYDGVETGSMPVLCPELADNCVVVNGVAKTYAMTGWRVGWMIGPTDVVKAATNLQSHATSNVANVSQRAALAAVSGDLSAVDEMKAAFDRRRKTIVRDAQRDRRRRLPRAAGRVLRLPVGQGAARQGVRRPRHRRPRAELAEFILDEAEVAVVPGRGVRLARLPAAVLRPRRRRPGRGRHPAAEALRRGSTGVPSCGRAARPAHAAQGAPAPALHRVDAARDAARARRARRHPAARRAGRGLAAAAVGGRREGLVPLPAALRRRPVGAAHRGRRTPAGAARPPRTTSREGGRLAGDPGRPERVRRAVRRDHRVHRPGARRASRDASERDRPRDGAW